MVLQATSNVSPYEAEEAPLYCGLRRSPEFKSKVALAALKGDKTLAQLSSEFGVCSVQISQWKAQLLQQLPNAFQHQERPVRAETLTAPLYQEIGRLKMELDWLKKKAGVDA